MTALTSVDERRRRSYSCTAMRLRCTGSRGAYCRAQAVADAAALARVPLELCAKRSAACSSGRLMHQHPKPALDFDSGPANPRTCRTCRTWIDTTVEGWQRSNQLESLRGANSAAAVPQRLAAVSTKRVNTAHNELSLPPDQRNSQCQASVGMRSMP